MLNKRTTTYDKWNRNPRPQLEPQITSLEHAIWNRLHQKHQFTKTMGLGSGIPLPSVDIRRRGTHIYMYIYIYIYRRRTIPPLIFDRRMFSPKPPKSCNLRHYVNTWSATCHNKPRKLHEFGGTKDTGDRSWDLLHQRADPHQLSYTWNFPLVLFLFPSLSNGKGFSSIITH